MLLPGPGEKCVQSGPKCPNDCGKSCLFQVETSTLVVGVYLADGNADCALKPCGLVGGLCVEDLVTGLRNMCPIGLLGDWCGHCVFKAWRVLCGLCVSAMVTGVWIVCLGLGDR